MTTNEIVCGIEFICQDGLDHLICVRPVFRFHAAGLIEIFAQEFQPVAQFGCLAVENHRAITPMWGLSSWPHKEGGADRPRL